MRQIKYKDVRGNCREIKIIPKAEIILPEKIKSPKLSLENLKIIHVLYGNNPHIYGEVFSSLKQNGTRENTHFVLGEHNRDFLLNNGVPNTNVILVNAPKVSNGSYFNKTFLIHHAAEYFLGKDILFFDYDCNLVRPLNKMDMYARLKNNRQIIQCPPIYYKHKRWGFFPSIDGSIQEHGPCSCLVYWEKPEIIKKWFSMHLKHLEIGPDEPPLFMALEALCGKLSLDDLYNFDTNIINIRFRATNTSRYKPDDYKEIYFWHR